MKQRILPLMALAAILVALLCPFRAQAQEDASLTLYYQLEGAGFPELSVGIYRVAQDNVLVAPYDSFPVDISAITNQDQWDQLAETLWAYMVDNQVAPDREEITDETGTVCFTGLEPGLYFVRETLAERDGGTYIFRKFLVFVPTPNGDGTYNYAVEAWPKCALFVRHNEYSVTKLWQDAGHQAVRPAAVTVKIYQNGVLKETQVLHAGNNWTYSWTVSGLDTSSWTVVEEDVLSHYKVKIQENSGDFSLVNAYSDIPEPPQTGDSFLPLPWILAMCFSGIALVILGIFGRRRK